MQLRQNCIFQDVFFSVLKWTSGKLKPPWNNLQNYECICLCTGNDPYPQNVHGPTRLRTVRLDKH